MINLEKGQTVNLNKAGLNQVRMALGWDPAPGRRAIDLDASVLVYNGTELVETVSFKRLSGWGIRHSGDNLTGAGDGDDETIEVALNEVRGDALIFVVNSFRGQRFAEVANAYCRLDELPSGAELVRFDLSGEKQRSTGVIMAGLLNVNGAWEMTAIGEFANGRVAKDMIPHVTDLLSGASS